MTIGRSALEIFLALDTLGSDHYWEVETEKGMGQIMTTGTSIPLECQSYKLQRPAKYPLSYRVLAIENLCE